MNRYQFEPMANGPGRVLYAGKAQGNGAANLVAVNGWGNYTYARVAVGRYTVTFTAPGMGSLPETLNDMVCFAHPEIQGSTAWTTSMRAVTPTGSSGATFEIDTFSVAAATDVVAGNFIHWFVFGKNTNVPF